MQYCYNAEKVLSFVVAPSGEQE